MKSFCDAVIPADRIFGLLERDFRTRDIYRAVANALDPQNNPDLSAHKTLLRLATTRHGAIRLVTTNFDRLFDAYLPELQTYPPPRLPDLSREKDFNGVIYLHGKINDTGDGAEGGQFAFFQPISAAGVAIPMMVKAAGWIT